MLDNLYVLGSELLKMNRRLYVFLITYNNIKCNVIFHRLEKSHGYYPIQLEFVKVTDDTTLSCYAHKSSTDLKFSDFAEFFNINTGSGKAEVRDIFSSFYKSLNSQIPTAVTSLNKTQNDLMSGFINRHSSVKEAAKKYLYDFRLNSGSRSKYNNDKAAALYPDIYEHFKKDIDHSFFFSPNKADEVTLNQLLAKIRNRN